MLWLILTAGCAGSPEKKPSGKPSDHILIRQEAELFLPEGSLVKTRFAAPQYFERINYPDSSFQEYLRNLPLKTHGSPVKIYNGDTKARQVHAAVIDRDPGNKNLQQCADAVIRLRAEYLYYTGQFDAIHFNLTNGFQVNYSKWMEGYRIAVDGNKTRWVRSGKPGNSIEIFTHYLEFIYSYAGTLSLVRELKKVAMNELQPGDVFIQGGSPGHAVIVVDAAVNTLTGEKVFMLAQSYMPAQDIHFLKNLDETAISPWYRVDLSAHQLETPEWIFEMDDLRRF